MDDHFGVSARAENVALCFQLVPKRLEVVNLSVENDPDALVLVAEGLVAAGNINDGKPPHTQPDAAAAILAEIVRAAMRDDPAHGGENGIRGLLRPVEIQDAVDSTHDLSTVSMFSRRAVAPSPRNALRQYVFPRGASCRSIHPGLLPTGLPEPRVYSAGSYPYRVEDECRLAKHQRRRTIPHKSHLRMRC